MTTADQAALDRATSLSIWTAPEDAVLLGGGITNFNVALSDEGSRYRIGDTVLYRYRGSYTDEVVELRETVIEKRGNVLEIEVVATRGDDARAWIQVVTDTVENREAERVDALYELIDGERVARANRDNQDIARLYAWTIPPVRGRPGDVTRESETLRFLGEEHACEIERGVFEGPAPQAFTFATCESFLWTNGPAEIIDTEGNVVWRREVVEARSSS